MMKNIYKSITFLVIIVLLLLPGAASAQPQADENLYVKELNFVFLHGMGGTTCSLQLLSDWFIKKAGAYTYVYEQTHPDTKIEINTLLRCYPGYTDIDTWAKNVAESIDKHFAGRENLILVGHSMGGKTALYAVANNIGGLAEKVTAVITINSPVRSLDRYYPPGGGRPLDYCRTGLLGSDEGVCGSLMTYDSAADGKRIAESKHWLAFISAESAPLSPEFDRAGVDAWPRDMDDGIVPLSAQYAEGADVIYHGYHVHGAIGTSDETAEFIADQTLRYLFGLPVECSTFATGGTLEHKADWLLGKDVFIDNVGEIIASTGIIRHTNDSFTEWQEWGDVVGVRDAPSARSRSVVRQVSFPFFTQVKQTFWFNSYDERDCRIFLKTRVAPRSTIVVQYMIYRRPLLDPGDKRSFFEVKIIDGTPLTTITDVSWSNQNEQDTGLKIQSEAHSPFRWFNAEWRVYMKKTRQRDIINEIPGKAVKD